MQEQEQDPAAAGRRLQGEAVDPVEHNAALQRAARPPQAGLHFGPGIVRKCVWPTASLFAGVVQSNRKYPSSPETI